MAVCGVGSDGAALPECAHVQVRHGNGLDCAGLGWAGLGWAGLGWAGGTARACVPARLACLPACASGLPACCPPAPLPLPSCPVPPRSVIRRSTTLLVVSGEFWLFNKRPTRRSLAALLLMVGGAIFAGLTDLTYNLKGYVWVSICVVSTAAYLLLIRKLQESTGEH